MKPPAKLYKYCPFGVFSLRAINEAEIFHASPRQFNDPLDCNPTLDLDIDTEDAVRLLKRMLALRGRSVGDIEIDIRRLRYNATDPRDEEGFTTQDEERQFRWSLTSEILGEVNQEMKACGVLALSETYRSVLMWSHYADHHKGLCLEYDTTLFDVQTLGAVDYHAPRALRARDLARWKLDNDPDGERLVRQTYFYAKSGEWSYEREWRDVSPRAGVNVLHFKLSAVHFGLRTDFTVRQTIAKALAQDHDVELYRMWTSENAFELHRATEDRDYFEQSGIREPPFLVFGRFIEPPPAPSD